MLFNSFQFLFFFSAVVAAYFALPHRFRPPLLLIASYFFYASWKPAYLLLIVASTLVDYMAGRGIAATTSRATRRGWLLLSLGTNLGLLFGFKYFNFFSESLERLLGPFVAFDIPQLDVLLPVGISFYTFQTLSYTIDVYRDRSPAERNLVIFALYVSFFPQLVAGPIERSYQLLPQFRRIQSFDHDRVVSGLRMILLGLFKKIVLADNLAAVVDDVYGDSAGYAGPMLMLATYCFAFQIYYDFSAYTDIARGSARVLGFDLMENFRAPYIANSIADFWRRWHISLSTWFRDYLYVPLGGNRVSPWRWRLNVLVVFLVTGLWHGANWTFVAWGCLHGLCMVASPLTAGLRDRLSRALGVVGGRRRGVSAVVTFHLVCLSWVFFRAGSVSEALDILSRLHEMDAGAWSACAARLQELAAPLAFMAAMFAAFVASRVSVGFAYTVADKPAWIRWTVYYLAVLAIVFVGNWDSQEFIYFQF